MNNNLIRTIRYNQVVFDRNPIQIQRDDLEWENAILKGMSETKVAYMIPKKRKLEENSDEDQECEWMRAYVYHLREDPDSYFFEYNYDHHSVYYNRYTKKVTLSKIKSSSVRTHMS